VGEALTLTMGTMGDAVADGELRAVRTCVLGPVEAHASGRENRDMRESRDHVRSTCRARGAGGRHTTHAHGRAFDPGAPRPQPYRGERRVPLFSPACVPGLFNCELALSGSGSSYPDTLASARIFSRSRRPRRARISQADDDGF